MSVRDGGEGSAATGRRTRVRRPRLRASFVTTATGLHVLAVVIAASTLWPVYRSAEFVLLVGVTVVVGAVVAVAGAASRLSSFSVLLATVLVYLVLGVPLAIPSRAVAGVLPTADGFGELLAATALGWKRLLTITLPVGSYESLLVPAFILVLLATVVGLTIALRSRRGELAVLAPVGLYLAGIVLGPQEAWSPVISGLAMLSVAIAWSVWWRLRRRRAALERSGAVARSTRSYGHRTVAARAVAGTVVTVLVSGAVAAAVVEASPSSTPRTVARTLVEQPFDPRELVSPLTRFRVYEQQPTVDSTLFTVRGLGAGQLLRLATLDTYDGVSYTVGSPRVTSESGSFDRVPSSIDQSGVDGDRTTLAVQVGAYDDVWLPTVGRLESIAFEGADGQARRDDFVYNDVSGTAAVDGGISAGDSYRVDVVLPVQPTPEQLADLTPGSATVPASADVPEALTTALADDVRGVEGTGARLQSALSALRSDGYISHGVSADEPASRSGHGSDRIAELFTDPVMIGDAEQYATAAALMAGEIGFPSRVVMGFTADGDTPTGEAATITGGDVTAWIEVDTAEFGWVALDPVPEERPIPDDQVLDPSRLERPESVVQPPPREPQVRDEQTPPQSEQDDADLPPAWVGIVVLAATIAAISGLVVGIVAAPFLVIVAVKWRRRRRRRLQADPAARITGGWQEFHDALADHGIETPVAATRSEVAAVVGGSRPAVLARVADRASFAPSAPSGDDADRVWTAVSEMRRSLDTGATRWQRLKAAVSWRSLRGYHGRTRPER